MIRILFIALLGQLLGSCINMNEPQSQSQYIACRDNFDKRLVRLFPDRLPNSMLGFEFSAPDENTPGRLGLLKKYFLGNEYAEAKAEYFKQAKHKKMSTDQCFVLIDGDGGLHQEKCEDFYPIPTAAIFENSSDRKSKGRLPASEVILVAMEAGIFLEDTNNHSRYNLPENWTHGYSTGVTTNDEDKTIQIWLVVW